MLEWVRGEVDPRRLVNGSIFSIHFVSCTVAMILDYLKGSVNASSNH